MNNIKLLINSQQKVKETVSWESSIYQRNLYEYYITH